jgi:hypothetical protein
MLMSDLYWSAEIDYRRERLNRDWRDRPHRRRTMAALPPLRLSRRRRRPVAFG